MPGDMHAPYTTELEKLYGAQVLDLTAARLTELVDRYRGCIRPPHRTDLSERDSFLIVYPDQVQEAGQLPLQTLADFCDAHLRGMISGLHVLPFFPWSSDDGFSVKDYRNVDPALGDWTVVERLAGSFRIMFDGVVNHASAQSSWFRGFLKNEEPYARYFLTVDEATDLSQVVRPRSSPLVTDFRTTTGLRRVWTTFGPDQVDLDYHNPEVLLEIIDVLLGYAQRGAQFIRLDAIAYLWKESGTPCIHLPQTHAIIRLLRAVLDEVAPQVRLVTETNVAHTENLSYFGNGFNEAQLIYNFALPPLVLHTFKNEDAAILSEWASGLEPPTKQCSSLNFLASHDGIGLNAVRGLLPESAIAALTEQCLEHGGLVSYAAASDGTRRAYELNINYFDALSNPQPLEPLLVRVRRFMAAQAIMLCLRGIPGIYFHSLFGSRNWVEGPESVGSNRAINRQKLARADLESELRQAGSLRSMVFAKYGQLLAARSASTAFHPNGDQQILDAGRGVFAALRTSPDGAHQILCLTNVTARRQEVHLASFQAILEPYESRWVDFHSTLKR